MKFKHARLYNILLAAGNGGSSSADSRANDPRRVTFGGPAADVIRPKPPRQQTTTGMSTRQSWPNINQPSADTIPTEAADIAGPSNMSPNHLFHTCHGKNIVLSPNRKLATRSGSFCNAIVFTYRPLRLQDPLHLQLIQSTQGWSGVIRFGFTCHCPDRLKPNTMPKYACPDLTVKQGYWVKALRETLAANGNILSFFVNSRGEVFYSINGEPYHMFFNGVDVAKPLWALIDVYGNTTGIRIIGKVKLKQFCLHCYSQNKALSFEKLFILKTKNLTNCGDVIHLDYLFVYHEFLCCIFLLQVET